MIIMLTCVCLVELGVRILRSVSFVYISTRSRKTNMSYLDKGNITSGPTAKTAQ